MTFLRLTTITARRLGRYALRLSSSLRLIVAAAILATSGVSLLDNPEAEAAETSAPAEERGEYSEFFATAGCIPARRFRGRTTRALGLRRNVIGIRRLYAVAPRPVRGASGHRLANGLCAPLRC